MHNEIHYRKRQICRVFLCLPSVFPRQSANKFFAECCAKNTRQKKNTRQRGGLPSVRKNTRQRGGLPSVKKKHSPKRVFAECFLFCTRQRNKIFFLGKKEKEKMKKKLCRVPRCRTLGKGKKSFFWERRRRKKMKKNFAECPDLGHSAKK